MKCGVKAGRIVWFVLGAPFLTMGALASSQSPGTVLKESWKWVREGGSEDKPKGEK